MGAGKKNRPEDRLRTTTSPLVVQIQITWPVGSMARQFKKSLLNRTCVRKKGRAGGRARRPARPLAGEPFHVSEATAASGVVSCKVIVRLSWSWLSRCSSSCQRDGQKANPVPEAFSDAKGRSA